MSVTEKTGSLVAIKEVVDTDDLMIINKSGITIRTPVSNLRVMGRATQGVRLIKLGENDEISSVEKIKKEEETEEELNLINPEEGSNQDDSPDSENNVTEEPNN